LKSEEMARDYVRRASLALGEATNAFSSGDYALSVRRAQEAVEFSLKAALRYLAIEYPREHDLSEILRHARSIRQFPPWFAQELDFMAEVSADLATKRGLAFYGDEVALRPPSSLFSEAEGKEAIEKAKRVYGNCARLIQSR